MSVVYDGRTDDREPLFGVIDEVPMPPQPFQLGDEILWTVTVDLVVPLTVVKMWGEFGEWCMRVEEDDGSSWCCPVSWRYSKR